MHTPHLKRWGWKGEWGEDDKNKLRGEEMMREGGLGRREVEGMRKEKKSVEGNRWRGEKKWKSKWVSWMEGTQFQTFKINVGGTLKVGDSKN